MRGRNLCYKPSQKNKARQQQFVERNKLTNTKEQIERWYGHLSKVLHGTQGEGIEGKRTMKQKTWKTGKRIVE
jgi:tRNA C32,U32 (ribose-2'-O)-methylase TrmJ